MDEAELCSGYVIAFPAAVVEVVEERGGGVVHMSVGEGQEEGKREGIVEEGSVEAGGGWGSFVQLPVGFTHFKTSGCSSPVQMTLSKHGLLLCLCKGIR